jgi:hypothetical protein
MAYIKVADHHHASQQNVVRVLRECGCRMLMSQAKPIAK